MEITNLNQSYEELRVVRMAFLHKFPIVPSLSLHLPCLPPSPSTLLHLSPSSPFVSLPLCLPPSLPLSLPPSLNYADTIILCMSYRTPLIWKCGHAIHLPLTNHPFSLPPLLSPRSVHTTHTHVHVGPLPSKWQTAELLDSQLAAVLATIYHTFSSFRHYVILILKIRILKIGTPH